MSYRLISVSLIALLSACPSGAFGLDIGASVSEAGSVAAEVDAGGQSVSVGAEVDAGGAASENTLSGSVDTQAGASAATSSDAVVSSQASGGGTASVGESSASGDVGISAGADTSSAGAGGLTSGSVSGGIDAGGSVSGSGSTVVPPSGGGTSSGGGGGSSSGGTGGSRPDAPRPAPSSPAPQEAPAPAPTNNAAPAPAPAERPAPKPQRAPSPASAEEPVVAEEDAIAPEEEQPKPAETQPEAAPAPRERDVRPEPVVAPVPAPRPANREALAVPAPIADRSAISVLDFPTEAERLRALLFLFKAFPNGDIQNIDEVTNDRLIKIIYLGDLFSSNSLLNLAEDLRDEVETSEEINAAISRSTELATVLRRAGVQPGNVVAIETDTSGATNVFVLGTSSDYTDGRGPLVADLQQTGSPTDIVMASMAPITAEPELGDLFQLEAPPSLVANSAPWAEPVRAQQVSILQVPTPAGEPRSADSAAGEVTQVADVPVSEPLQAEQPRETLIVPQPGVIEAGRLPAGPTIERAERRTEPTPTSTAEAPQATLSPSPLVALAPPDAMQQFLASRGDGSIAGAPTAFSDEIGKLAGLPGKSTEGDNFADPKIAGGTDWIEERFKEGLQTASIGPVQLSPGFTPPKADALDLEPSAAAEPDACRSVDTEFALFGSRAEAPGEQRVLDLNAAALIGVLQGETHQDELLEVLGPPIKMSGLITGSEQLLPLAPSTSAIQSAPLTSEDLVLGTFEQLDSLANGAELPQRDMASDLIAQQEIDPDVLLKSQRQLQMSAETCSPSALIAATAAGLEAWSQEGDAT